MTRRTSGVVVALIVALLFGSLSETRVSAAELFANDYLYINDTVWSNNSTYVLQILPIYLPPSYTTRTLSVDFSGNSVEWNSFCDGDYPNLCSYYWFGNHSNQADVVDDSGFAVMQTDGNFVLYTSSWVAEWSTQTSDNSGNGYLNIQNDGNFVIYDGDSNPLWNACINYPCNQ